MFINYKYCNGMRELTRSEIMQVGGGLGPLAAIGIDLALNGVHIAYATFQTGDYMRDSQELGGSILAAWATSFFDHNLIHDGYQS
jgi:hypothetical protein